jgi:PPOX class probable F420-dependent enzyme
MPTNTQEIEIPSAHGEILAANRIGMMSTLRHKDGLITTNPVGYLFEDGCVRISTIKGRVKYDNLLANPTVTLCVVDQADTMRYVELRGFATIEEDPDRSFLHHTFRAADMEPPNDLDPDGTERVIVRIHPQQSSSPVMYGGRFGQEQ